MIFYHIQVEQLRAVQPVNFNRSRRADLMGERGPPFADTIAGRCG